MNPSVPEAFLNQGEWTRGITHELVHAFDACRAELRPSDCSHIACTEIRAANLSGDCDFGVELSRTGPLRFFLGGAAPSSGGGLAGRQQACVRRRAELSLSMHEGCREAAAPAAGRPSASSRDAVAAREVDKVWEACYRDTAPFATN